MSDPIVYACILAALVLGWVACIVCWHRPDRANRAILHATEVDDLVDEIGRLSDEVNRAEEGREWAELAAETARFRADCAETRAGTAIRGLLHNQARAELLRPDEPCGQTNVIELRVDSDGRLVR